MVADTDTMALVRRAVEEVWNGGDLAVADVLFAADYINHAGLISDLVSSPEASQIAGLSGMRRGVGTVQHLSHESIKQGLHAARVAGDTTFSA